MLTQILKFFFEFHWKVSKLLKLIRSKFIIYHFVFVACSRFRPLGMKDGKIKESQLSSSSYMKTERNKSGNCPHFSRPGSVGVFMVEDGMLHFDRNNFLQVDFRTKTKVEMVMKLKLLL